MLIRVVMLIMTTVISGATFAQESFTCDGQAYMTHGKLNANGVVVISKVDTQAQQLDTTFTNSQNQFNILAYNYHDNFIYSVHTQNKNVYRLDQSGNFTDLGVIPNLTENANLNGGDFDGNGVLVITAQTVSKVFRVDISGGTPTLISSVVLTAAGGGALPRFADFSYNRLDGKFYGVNRSDGTVSTLDPVTGVVTPVSSVASNLSIGATFFGPDHEQLYCYGRPVNDPVNNRMYRCDISTGICTLLWQDLGSDNVDACACNRVCEDVDTTVVDSFCIGKRYFFQDTNYTVPGSYLHVFQRTGGCDSLVTLQLSYSSHADCDTTTGIAAGKPSSVRMYPNPATDEIRLVGFGHSNPVTVEVFSSAGRKVMSAQVCGQEPMDVTGLPAGVYILHVGDGENTLSLRLVKR